MSRQCITPKISVIIPVYNAEKYLRKTLNSVLRQTIDSFEVIMVNDASTDASLSILEEYRRKFSLSTVVNFKTNKGLSIARNMGIKIAKGQYLSFIDSDDLVEPGFLCEMYNNAISSNTDIVCCNYYYLKENGFKRKNFLSFPSGIFNSKKMLKILIYDVRIHFFCWNKIWRRELIKKNKICFNGRCFEDILFSIKGFYYSKSIKMHNKPLYYYLKSPYSMSHFMSLDKLAAYIYALYSLRKFLEEKNIYKTHVFIFSFLSLRFLLSCFYRLTLIYINSRFTLNIQKAFYIICKTVFCLVGNNKKFESIENMFLDEKFILSS